jgi:hypothetical protein
VSVCLWLWCPFAFNDDDAVQQLIVTASTYYLPAVEDKRKTTHEGCAEEYAVIRFNGRRDATRSASAHIPYHLQIPRKQQRQSYKPKPLTRRNLPPPHSSSPSCRPTGRCSLRLALYFTSRASLLCRCSSPLHHDARLGGERGVHRDHLNGKYDSGW